jgi:hypothetical protein
MAVHSVFGGNPGVFGGNPGVSGGNPGVSGGNPGAAASAELSSPARSLPPRASLENLRNQAKTLQKQHREGNGEAVARVAVWLGTAEPPATLDPAERPAGAAGRSQLVVPLRLHDAQFVLAREYGFASWPRLVEHFEAQQSRERVRRENGRVWIEGVPRLRWGQSPEPTYIGALEAAFRSSDRPLDITTLMGDSGLGFRLRWATRDGGNAWCGSGPCGEWPEEVAALAAATGYVYEFVPPEPRRPLPPEFLARVTEHIDRGWPLLGFGKQMDLGVIFGYEDAGRRLLFSDYWATEEPSVMAADEAKAVCAFLQRIEEPAPRAVAVRAGLELTLRRWNQGVVDPDPMTGAAYHYGAAGYERWLADLERAPALTPAQLGNLWFLNGWTYSSLHMNRSEYAASYLRANAEHLPAAAQTAIGAAAGRYDQLRERLGNWDPADPTFGMVKQKKVDSWTPEVRARELLLLRDVYALETQAMRDIAQALSLS